MKKSLYLTLILAFLVSACSGGSDSNNTANAGDDNNSPDISFPETETETQDLITFEVINPQQPDDASTPINTIDTINVTWTTSKHPYTINFYLSDNETLSDLDEELFYYDCPVADECHNSGTEELECIFNNSNELTCANSDSGITVDLTDSLPQLPFDAYWIAEYCTFPLDDCIKTISQPVQFQ